MIPLHITSLQAGNAHFTVAAIADYLARRLGTSIEFVVDIPWQKRELLLDAGQIQVAWICG
jgi:ABC-type phosphate/phosphonate transport system substrate-binding protein